MSYLKKFIFSLKEVIITYLLGYIIIIISCIIYTLLGKSNLTKFINHIAIYILLIYYLITIIYLYFHNKKQEPSLPIKSYFPIISLGISLALSMNMLIFKLIPPTNTRTISLSLAFLTSALIGPIYEEIIFRYIFLNKLKKFNTPKKAILINSIIFALIHLSPIKMIYAFILGITLNIAYEKYQNILAPILIHIAANTIVLFITEYNPYILLLSILNLIISLNLTNILKK